MLKNKPEDNKKESVQISLSKKTVRYLLLIILFAAVVVWGVNNSDSFLGVIKWFTKITLPFIVGLCCAFILNAVLVPLENLWKKIFKKGKDRPGLRRGVCIFLSIILVFLLVFAVGFIIAPKFIETFSSFVNNVPYYIESLEKQIDAFAKWLDGYGIVIPELELNGFEAKKILTSLINNYGEGFVNTTVNFTAGIFSGIVTGVLALAFSVYVLAQKSTLVRQLKKVIYTFFSHRRADRICGFVELTNLTFSRFITGQFLEAVIIGVLCFIGMLIFGFPYAGIISVLIGFTALIPIFGSFFGTGIGAFLILLVNPLKALLFVVFIIVLQQIEGNLIYPKVVGRSIGLPGIWVLVSVTIGGNAWGIVGMLLAVPMCSVFYCILKEYVAKRLRHKHIEIE